MGFKDYWGGQFGRPTGVGGWIAAFIMNRINKAMYKAAVRESKDFANILDVGFGNGFLLGMMIKKRRKSKFFGIDISGDMVRAAGRRNKRAGGSGRLVLSEGGVEKIPFDEKFGQIFAVNTIYFWGDLAAGLREIYGKLDEGGEFIAVSYTKKWLCRLGGFTRNFKKYTEQELSDAMQAAGFETSITEIKRGKSFYIKAVKFINRKDIRNR
jgi:SAM-dependent methyltransferase